MCSSDLRRHDPPSSCSYPSELHTTVEPNTAHTQRINRSCVNAAMSSHISYVFFFSSRRRHTRYWRDWSSDVCSSDLDPSGFQIGVNIANTPGKVIFRNDLIELIQYAQTTEKVLKRPLLIVPPWINKFYVLDLSPEKSLIRWLVEKGHTVFVVSWVNPDDRHADKSFEDYMKEGILEAIDVVEKATGERQVNAVGYCVGGTLLSMTLGYMALHGDDRIASATLLTTQVDFEFAGDLEVLFDADRIGGIEAEMAKTGYLEGSKMANAFNVIRSNDLIWPYVVNNYMKG